MSTSVKFKAKVSAQGTIQVPSSHHLENEEVEVTIVSKKSESLDLSADDFVARWSGFLAGHQVEESKFEYLSKKYK